MDQFPTELWLRTFSYLHTIDILYSFDNLNTCVQQLIILYQSNINLSDISFATCKRFVEHILPVYGPNIRSLTLKGKHQIEFCIENNILQSVINLQCLRIKGDYKNTVTLSSDFFSEHLKHLSKLVELDLYNVIICLTGIDSFKPPPLTHMSWGCANEGLAAMRSEPFQYIKVLKTYLENANELRRLKFMKHLRELYVCVVDLDDSNHFRINNFPIPSSLSKLHLEYRESGERQHASFQILKELLIAFRKQLQSLTLIIDSNATEYADYNKLQIFQSGFSRLTSFQYLIHTSRCPSNGFDHVKKLPNNTYLIYTMKPRRPISYFQLLWDDGSSPLSVERLYFTRALNLANLTAFFPQDKITIDYKLPHFRYLSYIISKETESKSEEKQRREENLILPFFGFIPNLKFIELAAEYPEDILGFLERMSSSPQKIDCLRCTCSKSLDSTFFLELSRKLPYLKSIYLDECSLGKSTDNNQLQLPITLLDNIRKYFTNIIFMEFFISTYDHRTSKKTTEYVDSILWLNQHSDNLIYFDRTVENSKYETHIISVWL